MPSALNWWFLIGQSRHAPLTVYGKIRKFKSSMRFGMVQTVEDRKFTLHTSVEDDVMACISETTTLVHPFHV